MSTTARIEGFHRHIDEERFKASGTRYFVGKQSTEFFLGACSVHLRSLDSSRIFFLLDLCLQWTALPMTKKKKPSQEMPVADTHTEAVGTPLPFPLPKMPEQKILA